MMDHIPVEPFPPGDYIKEELEARGWTQDDLAEVMGRSRQHVANLLSGRTSVTPETAHELSQALCYEPETWMKLQAAYELALAAKEERSIAKRAEIYKKVPAREMRKRNWIADTDTPEELEAELCQLLRIGSLDEQPTVAMAARKSTSYEQHTLAQVAWACRALDLAKRVGAARYDDGKIDAGIRELRQLAAYPEDARRVPAMLADMGVRLVIVQHLQGTKIDGAALWLDENTPVIALSLRFGRIDNFWHTLIHECVHIKYRDKAPVDVDIDEVPSLEDGRDIEVRANAEAANYLVPSDKLQSFILRHKPLFYQTKIVQFAQARGVHPGIVVGQLQRREVIKYTQLRKLLVDVRSHIIGAALTDGWGDCPVTS